MGGINTIIYKIYDFYMDAISKLFFRYGYKPVNVFNLEWDHLIILDACRFDVFSKVYDVFFDTTKIVEFEKIISPASSTMEFIKKCFSDKKVLERVGDKIFINSNPVIDNTFKDMGLNPKDIFYKYVPVWKKHWDYKIGSVKPDIVYDIAFKVHLQYPNKGLIVWFLQPHYPYLDEKFNHINKIGRNFMNQSLNSNESNFKIILKILKKMITEGYLSAGIPDGLAECMRRNVKDVQTAYILNLILVLKYVKKLTDILPGKIIITSDHGEAFGEYLTKLLPIKVYGHPSRVRIPPLVKVPYLKISSKP